jgi:hypothetical protein
MRLIEPFTRLSSESTTCASRRACPAGDGRAYGLQNHDAPLVWRPSLSGNACRYFCVVLMLRCPRRSLTTWMSTPPASNQEACACRRISHGDAQLDLTCVERGPADLVPEAAGNVKVGVDNGCA